MTARLPVRSVGFSPVKGMRHLALDHVDVDAQGARGDRAFCVVDAAGRRVLRTVQHPALVGVDARTRGTDLVMTFPDGRSVAGPAPATGGTLTCDYWGRDVDLALTEGPHARAITEYLGTEVRLAAAPRGAVVYAAPITVVTTASLAALGVPSHGEHTRFRATLLVETTEPFVEDTWHGTEFRAGDAIVRIGSPVPRCAVIDLHPVTGARDTHLLRSLARSRPTNDVGEPTFGVFATCVTSGRITPDR